MQLLTEKQKIAFSILLGVVFLAFVGVYLWGDIAPRNSKQTGEFYVNAKGQQWTLPEGDYSFTVASAKYPKFLGGTVSPVKVFPGDTQKMVVSIASPVPLKKVTASIDTDNRTQNFTLRLRESKAISSDFFRNQKYLVGEDNKLIINQGSSYAAKLVNELVAKAEAQALVEYTYEGEWIVNDTHTKTYHTKFIAEDENGGADSITLAWSDPVCDFRESEGVAVLQDNCSPSGGAEGVDGISANLNGFTIALQDNSSFYWNGGLEMAGPIGPKEIIMNAGTFTLGNNTQIKEALLYYIDEDEDTWAGDVAYSLGCEGQCSPRIRVKNSPSRPWIKPLNGGLDCADNNANVFPGQTLYFGEMYQHPQFGNSYDYDCSGGVTGGWGNNEENPESVSSVYSRIFVGKEEDGSKYCEAGAEIPPEDFYNSYYCGNLSEYSIEKCEPGFPDLRFSEEIFPREAISGFMTRDCDVCIGTTLRGFCH